MFEMTNENFARLLNGLTIAVGNRKNRILFYQFLAAEFRALHYSYGVGDSESYKRARCRREWCWNSVTRSPAFREYPVRRRGQSADRWALWRASANHQPCAC